MLYICSKLLLDTERMRLGAFDFHSALPFRIQLLRRAKTSNSFVRSSRLAEKRVRLVSEEFTKNGLNTCCEQLGFSIMATTKSAHENFLRTPLNTRANVGGQFWSCLNNYQHTNRSTIYSPGFTYRLYRLKPRASRSNGASNKLW